MMVMILMMMMMVSMVREGGQHKNDDLHYRIPDLHYPSLVLHYPRPSCSASSATPVRLGCG